MEEIPIRNYIHVMGESDAFELHRIELYSDESISVEMVIIQTCSFLESTGVFKNVNVCHFALRDQNGVYLPHTYMLHGGDTVHLCSTKHGQMIEEKKKDFACSTVMVNGTMPILVPIVPEYPSMVEKYICEFLNVQVGWKGYVFKRLDYDTFEIQMANMPLNTTPVVHDEAKMSVVFDSLNTTVEVALPAGTLLRSSCIDLACRIMELDPTKWMCTEDDATVWCHANDTVYVTEK